MGTVYVHNFLCCSDFTVRLVDVESSSFNVLTEHEAPVLSVALSPDGSLAVSKGLIYSHII